VVDIEVDRKGIALRWSYVNDGGAGGKVLSREIELESSAGEGAAAFIGADVVGLAGRREGSELTVLAGNLDVEIFPEIVGTGDEAFGRTGTGTRGANDVRAIGIGELDLHDDSDEFGLLAVIERCLLSAVT